MSGEITNYVIASEERARQPRTLQGGLTWFAITFPKQVWDRLFLATINFRKIKP